MKPEDNNFIKASEKQIQKVNKYLSKIRELEIQLSVYVEGIVDEKGLEVSEWFYNPQKSGFEKREEEKEKIDKSKK